MQPVDYRRPILIVDDEREILEALRECLMSEGYEVLTCPDPLKVEDLVRDKGIEVVVLDIQMPRLSGLDLLKNLQALDHTIAPIVMTAYGSVERAVEAMRRGAYDFLSKPFGLDVFLMAVRKAVERVNLIRQNQRLAEEVRLLKPASEMIGNSRALERVVEVARRVASSDVTVLITGESGTGKEVMAEFIVKDSNRADEPFVKINCAALPETLLESELFGHEKGAFTGAVTRQIGKFEMAHQGSLFLDEIGEMSPTTQTKLLRVIQEKSFQRLGGQETVTSDVRLIAATNKNLLEEIGKGRFREDLYYRLNVIEIDLPPLRERREDIPMLLGHFARVFAAKHGRPMVDLDTRCLRRLTDYPWPGNIRQLKNFVERVTLLHRGGGDIAEDVESLVADSSGKPAVEDRAEGGPLLSLEEAEVAYIKRVLEKAGGNRTHAAQILKIDPKTLRSKLRKAGVPEGRSTES